MGILLREVHRDGAVSRTELAARMGVNRSTILTLIAKLADAGLVREEPSAATGRSGRPSLVVRPEPGRAYVLAFDVAMDRLVAARVGLGGTVLSAGRRSGGAGGTTWRTWSPSSPGSGARSWPPPRRTRRARGSARRSAA